MTAYGLYKYMTMRCNACLCATFFVCKASAFLPCLHCMNHLHFTRLQSSCGFYSSLSDCIHLYARFPASPMAIELRHIVEPQTAQHGKSRFSDRTSAVNIDEMSLPSMPYSSSPVGSRVPEQSCRSMAEYHSRILWILHI